MVSLGLWLGLLAAVCAKELVLLPKYAIKSLTPLSASGTIFYTEHFISQNLLAADFCLSAWIYVASATADVAFFFIQDVDYYFLVKWPSTGDAFVTYIASATVNGIGNRPDGKWFHMVMGGDFTTTFIVVSLKQPPTFQFSAQANQYGKLDTADFMRIPDLGPNGEMDVSLT